MGVMDNPSSVITQVSRDEEGGKAAAERGECLYFCPARAHVRGGGGGGWARKSLAPSSRPTTRELHRKLLYRVKTRDFPAKRRKVKLSLSLCCAQIMIAALLACDESDGNDVLTLDEDGFNFN